jgi:CheY-like chemotaxis protein
MVKEKKPLSKVCIIWDNEQFPEGILGSATGKVHNRATFGNCKFDEFDLIYLLAEPIWDQKLRSDFYGFELGKELREKHNVLCPIIFCSFLKREHFFSLKIEGSEILNYPGHYTLQLPDKPETEIYPDRPVTDFYKGIDQDTLEDINLSLFNAEQIVHNLMHNTEDALPGLIYSLKEESKDEMKERASELLSKQLKIFGQKVEQGNETEFDSLCAEFIKSICSTIDSFETKKTFLLSEAQTLRQPFKLYKPQLYNLLPKKMQEGLAEPTKPKRWQVLFIDDDQSNCDVVCEYFKLNGITCHTATDAKTAFSKLREDELNAKRISMVIADFRLYENGDSLKGKWQEYQGYKILDEIHSNPDYKSHYVYAILTSKTGTIQKRIQKQSKFPILWFSKSDVLGGGISSFNFFCKDLEKVGSESYLKKMTIPNYGGWIKKVADYVDEKLNYSFLYKMHLESNDYESAEIEISSLLNKWKVSFPEDATLQPSFNFDKKDPQLLLKLFRQTILPYRLFFLYKKYIENYSFIDIYFCINTQYRDYYIDKQKKSEANPDIEKKLFQAMLSLFTNNWGFPIEKSRILNTNITKKNRKDDELLFEEKQFLVLNGLKIAQFSINDQDAIEVFLNDISNASIDELTKNWVNTYLDQLDKVNMRMNISFSHFRYFLKLLEPQIRNNRALENLVFGSEMFKQSYKSDCYYSSILISLLETFTLEVENG